MLILSLLCFFKVDPSEMMIAFQYMMKQKNYSAFSERIRRKISTAFEQFSDSAQRIGVYSSRLY
jgi:acyl-[acyl-carrier-protein] desaturase